jgi:hypothetical protein
MSGRRFLAGLELFLYGAALLAMLLYCLYRFTDPHPHGQAPAEVHYGGE